MIEQILESWPVACDRPYVDGTAVYDTRQYNAAAPIFESNGRNMPTYQKYRMVAESPVAEMRKWIQICEAGKKKPVNMITEPSVFAGPPLTEPSQFRGLAQNESVLHEVDPVTMRQNVDQRIQDSTGIPVDVTHRAQVQAQVNAEARSQAFWHEIDPTTGKPVDPEKTEHPLNGEMAGWKIL